MKPEDNRFLMELRKWSDVATSRELGFVVDRNQDRARQRCKRKGLVIFEAGYWCLTDAGRNALKGPTP